MSAHLTGAILAAAIRFHLPEQGSAYEQIALRWMHFAAGITWVGLLYFFNLVNAPFQKELDAGTRARIVPLLMPRAMWWFRWSAVVTVLAGLRYFTILAKTDADNAGDPGLVGRWLVTWFVVWTLTWFIVYLLTKYASGPLGDGRVLAVPIGLVIAAASWGVLELNANAAASNRTLAISVGGGMGYFMLLSVWGIVWRCQKRLIQWAKASGEQGTPMPAEATSLARLSFLTARTNFWLSFPMLFFMAASAHFPFLSGH